jgi:hypothetical protein
LGYGYTLRSPIGGRAVYFSPSLPPSGPRPSEPTKDTERGKPGCRTRYASWPFIGLPGGSADPELLGTLVLIPRRRPLVGSNLTRPGDNPFGDFLSGFWSFLRGKNGRSAVRRPPIPAPFVSFENFDSGSKQPSGAMLAHRQTIFSRPLSALGEPEGRFRPETIACRTRPKNRPFFELVSAPPPNTSETHVSVIWIHVVFAFRKPLPGDFSPLRSAHFWKN